MRKKRKVVGTAHLITYHMYGQDDAEYAVLIFRLGYATHCLCGVLRHPSPFP